MGTTNKFIFKLRWNMREVLTLVQYVGSVILLIKDQEKHSFNRGSGREDNKKPQYIKDYVLMLVHDYEMTNKKNIELIFKKSLFFKI